MRQEDPTTITNPNTLSRKEREKQYKRREILNAALVVFAERGYRHSTIEEIAGRAEFSVGTLYNYFSNKEGLFRAVLDDSFDAFERVVRTALSAKLSTRGTFRVMTVATLEYFNRYPEYLTIILKENLFMKVRLFPEFRENYDLRREKMVRSVARLLGREIKKGTVRNVETILLVEVFWNILYTFMMKYRLRGRKIPVEETADKVLAMFFDGVELK